MIKYRVRLMLFKFCFGEWTSDSLSEALGDYVVVSQKWFETVMWQIPDVTIDTINR